MVSTTSTETRSRPILFSGPMIRALLDRRKTQTRRIVKPQPHWKFPANAQRARHAFYQYTQSLRAGRPIGWAVQAGFGAANEFHSFGECPYGAPGDTLWVREAWLYVGPGSGSNLPIDIAQCGDSANHIPENFWYKADAKPEDRPLKWRSPIHMPRRFSRLTLRIESVKVERVQEASFEDLICEGCAARDEAGFPWAVDPATGERIDHGYLAYWQERWTALHGPDSWESNPWVWVISFTVIKTAPAPEAQANAG